MAPSYPGGPQCTRSASPGARSCRWRSIQRDDRRTGRNNAVVHLHADQLGQQAGASALMIAQALPRPARPASAPRAEQHDGKDEDHATAPAMSVMERRPQYEAAAKLPGSVGSSSPRSAPDRRRDGIERIDGACARTASPAAADIPGRTPRPRSVALSSDQVSSSWTATMPSPGRTGVSNEQPLLLAPRPNPRWRVDVRYLARSSPRSRNQQPRFLIRARRPAASHRGGGIDQCAGQRAGRQSGQDMDGPRRDVNAASANPSRTLAIMPPVT